MKHRYRAIGWSNALPRLYAENPHRVYIRVPVKPKPKRKAKR